MSYNIPLNILRNLWSVCPSDYAVFFRDSYGMKDIFMRKKAGARYNDITQGGGNVFLHFFAENITRAHLDGFRHASAHC